jgi:hypothetical protein
VGPCGEDLGQIRVAMLVFGEFAGVAGLDVRLASRIAMLLIHSQTRKMITAARLP